MSCAVGVGWEGRGVGGFQLSLFTGKRNDEEGAKEKLFTYASHVVVDTFKVRSCLSHLRRATLTSNAQGLETTVVEAE